MKWLIEILNAISESKLGKVTKGILYVLILVGVIIVIGSVTGDNDTDKEIIQVLNNQSKEIKETKSIAMAVSNELPYLRSDMNEGFDSTNKKLNETNLEVIQLKRTTHYILEESSNGIKKKVEESEKQHKETMEFIKDHSYKSKSIILKNEHHDSKLTYHIDSIAIDENKFEAIDIIIKPLSLIGKILGI